MSTIVEFDYEQGYRTADALRQCAQNIDAEIQRLQHAADAATVEWRGRSQQIFIEQWGELRRSSEQIARELEELATRLRQKARQFEEISQTL